MAKRLDLGGLAVAALTAPLTSWATFWTGTLIVLLPEVIERQEVGVFIVFPILLMVGALIALVGGTLGAAAMLALLLLLAESISERRPPLRKKAILACGAGAGLAFAAVGLLCAPFDIAPVNQLTYVAGLWPWTLIYRDPDAGWLGYVGVTLAPIVGGLAAGLAYDGATKAIPRG